MGVTNIKSAHFRSAADEGDAPGAGQLQNAVRTHEIDEGLDLALLAGHFDHHGIRADIDDAGAEHFHQQSNFGPLEGRRLDLDEHQIAFDVVFAADVLHADNRDDLVELFAGLLHDAVVAVDDKGHARQARVLVFADGQTIDIEAARGEHA